MNKDKKVIIDKLISIIFSEILEFILDIFKDDTINIKNKNNLE